MEERTTIPPAERLAKARVSKNVKDQPRMKHCVLPLQVVTAELKFLQHQPRIPKSETMTSTPDDAELPKDLRGLGKPPLFDGNDTDVSLFPMSEDDSILLRHMDDVVDTGPDKCHRHRVIREMDNQMNQNIEDAADSVH